MLHRSLGQGSPRMLIATLVAAATLATVAAAQSPGAQAVVGYDAGTTPTAGYTTPTAALGTPARVTGHGSPYEAVVSPFNPPWDTDQVVSIGEGGYLTLEFAQPITNDAAHPFGVDALLFGNAGFYDAAWPSGTLTSPPILFGDDAAQFAVSADGVNFVDLGPITAGLFPTIGYSDAGAYATTAGSVPTDFQRPVNPALTLSDFDGLTYAEVLALYDGSAGGTPLDISGSGLESVRFVRIAVPDDGDAETALNFEIDALVAVPEPAGILLLLAAAVVCRRPARRTRLAEVPGCVR